MSLELFSRVVLTEDIVEEGLRKGDVATIVETHLDASGNLIGLELELFSANGETVAVASVRPEAVRASTSSDRLAARRS